MHKIALRSATGVCRVTCTCATNLILLSSALSYCVSLTSIVSETFHLRTYYFARRHKGLVLSRTHTQFVKLYAIFDDRVMLLSQSGSIPVSEVVLKINRSCVFSALISALNKFQPCGRVGMRGTTEAMERDWRPLHPQCWVDPRWPVATPVLTENYIQTSNA